MKLKKRMLIIVISMIFLGLTYNFIRLVNHKQIININAIKKPQIPQPLKEEKRLTPKTSEKLAIYDSLDIKEKVYKSSSTTKINNKIPILMYHSISYEKGNTLRVSKENFKKQMRYLKDNNYTTLTVDELYNYMETGEIVPKKPIIITFDDGYEDNYINAYPILKELKFNATVFVITNTIDIEKNYLTTNEIKSMDANNIRIESHTASHEHLTKISYNDNIKTMKSSKDKLEKILKRKINFIAYPYGEYNKNTIKATKEVGYTLAFSTDFGWIDKSSNIYSLGRIFVNSNFSFDEFKSKLNP